MPVMDVREASLSSPMESGDRRRVSDDEVHLERGIVVPRA